MNKSERQYVPGGDRTTQPIPIRFKKPGETNRGYEAPRQYVPGGDRTLHNMAGQQNRKNDEELKAMMRALQQRM